jgi:undecaprenyl pyrophosphate phosphatase UppP
MLLFSLSCKTCYCWFVYFLAFLGAVALFDHLMFRSPTFPFTTTHALALAFFALFGLLEAVAGFFSPRIRTREKRHLLMFSIYALISVLIIVFLRLVGVQLNTTLFRWDWPITVLLIIGAGGLFWLKSRFTRDKVKEAV